MSSFHTKPIYPKQQNIGTVLWATVHWGYNNIQIQKKDEWKAAFKTNKELFKPTVMFFGMCNSPATFQSMMDKIFVTMIEEKLVIIYMDNILIFAKTKEELKRITKLVLENLEKMIYSSRRRNVNLKRQKLNTLEWLLKKDKSQWILSN